MLEAKERLGGRTLSVSVPNHDNTAQSVLGKVFMAVKIIDWRMGQHAFSNSFADLGGHWICDRQKEIMDLAKEFGIEYYEQNVKGTKVTQLGDEGKVG